MYLAGATVLDGSMSNIFDRRSSSEIHSILDGFLSLGLQGAGGKAGGLNALLHRVAALLRRYMQAQPQQAAQLLNAHAARVQ